MNTENNVQGLKALREARGITQLQVAKACNVSLGAVQKWDVSMSGMRARNLLALRDLLGLTIDEIVGLKPIKEKGKK